MAAVSGGCRGVATAAAETSAACKAQAARGRYVIALHAGNNKDEASNLATQ
jgi:hypothetical protein